jgi:hypothetical protein
VTADPAAEVSDEADYRRHRYRHCRSTHAARLEAGVGLASRTEVGFDAEMQLDAVTAKPASTAGGEDRGLGNLGQTEHTLIEVPQGGFASGRTGQLDMVQHRNSSNYLDIKGMYLDVKVASASPRPARHHGVYLPLSFMTGPDR